MRKKTDVADLARWSNLRSSVLTSEGKWPAFLIANKASELANSLGRAGNLADRAIAVISDSPIEALVAALAIWQHGATYMPINPSTPSGRLIQMYQTVAPAATITFRMGWLEEATLETAVAQSTLLSYGTDAAYILFTSGSTGIPKAVAVSHEALSLRLLGLVDTAAAGDLSTILLQTHPTFDISLPEMLLTALMDVHLRVLSDGERHDPDLLQNVLSEPQMLAQGTPSFWKLVRMYGWHGNPSLRVWAAGEVLHTPLALWLNSRAESVWNLYGPTEATIYATAYRVVGSEEGISIPLGKALPSTQLSLESGPDGSELLVGGPCLALGYVGDSAATSRAFAETGISRIYKTGDLVRTLESTLIFDKRKDSQRKVRGYRVEIGDVESALLAVEGVHEAAVVSAERGSDGSTVLHAFVVTKLTERAIRSRLLETLLPYMIPSVIDVVDHLPKTTSFKVDRALLTKWAEEHAQRLVH